MLKTKGSQNHSGHSKMSKYHQNEPVLNPDENTTNSVFDSAYDDTSSSLPHVANSNQQTVSFGSNQHSHPSAQNGSNNNHINYNSINININNNIKNC